MTGLTLAILLAPLPLLSADFYAAPNGTPQASGSLESPWDLTTALAQPPMVRPGDTIWLREGRYKGMYVSRLSGSSSAPITVRAYRGERAVIDPAALDPQNRAALTVFGRFTWFWNLEVTNSEPSRLFPNSFDVCPNRQHCRPEGISVFGPGTKIINCVVHDTGGGIGLWSAAAGSEAYGNIVFFIGWQGRNGGAGHSIYAQNRSGISRIENNVLFSSFHSGIHAYGSSDAFLRNFQIESNTIFSAGLLGEDPQAWGILVGGNARAENITVARNMIYHPDWYRRSNNLNPSYGIGATGLVLEGNYSAGVVAIGSDVAPNGFRGSHNLFGGDVSQSFRPLVGGQPNGNTVTTMASLRSGPNKVFVTRNRYEPNIATVTVFNWQGGDTAALDLSSFLKPGEQFDIVDIQNWFAGSVVSGTYDGSPVRVPMQSGSSKPVGEVRGNRYRTGPEFGVFQVRIRKPEPPPNKKLQASLERLRFTRNSRGAEPGVSSVFTLALSPDASAQERWSVVSAPSWLNLSSSQGTTPERIGVLASESGLDPGIYESDLILSANESEDLVVPARLTVLSELDNPVIDRAVHAGHLGPLVSKDAPFSLIGVNLAGETVRAGDPMAPLPAALGGAQVFVGGLPAGLVEVSPNRIVAMLPADAEPRSGYVEVTVQTQRGSATVVAEVSPLSLGVMEFDGVPGLVNAEYPDAGATAKPSDVISVFLAGLPAAAMTSMAPNAAILAWIGTLNAPVLKAERISPGLVKVSLQVPDVPDGNQPVLVQYNDARSQTGAYLPVAR